MSERSVISVGGSLMISLSAQWCRDNGVEKGSVVTVTENADGSLLVEVE